MQLPQEPVDLLILGAGWTSQFLIPLVKERGLSFTATSRSGRDGTIPFIFDPNATIPGASNKEQHNHDDGNDTRDTYARLPDAHTVLITFPITVSGAPERLVHSYLSTRHQQRYNQPPLTAIQFIQLGSTSALLGDKSHSAWYDRHSAYDMDSLRVAAEKELLSLNGSHYHDAVITTTVLHLAGLWGNERDMRRWVGRVAPSKEALKAKGSLHMIHGTDVSRAILAVQTHADRAAGQRWLVTDMRVYDWWDLASAWGDNYTSTYSGHSGGRGGRGAPISNSSSSSSPSPQASTTMATSTTDPLTGPTPTHEPNAPPTATTTPSREPHAQWVLELMLETGIRSVPRDVELLGRAIDSREFWATFGITPVQVRLE